MRLRLPVSTKYMGILPSIDYQYIRANRTKCAFVTYIAKWLRKKKKKERKKVQNHTIQLGMR